MWIKIEWYQKEAEIRVKVFVQPLVNHDKISADGWVSLEENATLADLYRKLNIPLPLRSSLLFFVNYEKSQWDTNLNDGDNVAFLMPFGGG